MQPCRGVSCFRWWDNKNERLISAVQKKEQKQRCVRYTSQGKNRVQWVMIRITGHPDPLVCVCVSVCVTWLLACVQTCMKACVKRSINVRLDPRSLTSHLEVMRRSSSCRQEWWELSNTVESSGLCSDLLKYCCVFCSSFFSHEDTKGRYTFLSLKEMLVGVSVFCWLACETLESVPEVTFLHVISNITMAPFQTCVPMSKRC